MIGHGAIVWKKMSLLLEKTETPGGRERTETQTEADRGCGDITEEMLRIRRIENEGVTVQSVRTSELTPRYFYTSTFF